MTTCLDLSELRLSAQGRDAVLVTQPGFAYLAEGSAPAFGSDAVTKVKLHPAQIQSRFWSELSTDPIDSLSPKVRHHADIAWHALKELSTEIDLSDLIVCVPSSIDEDNLALLAGILESLGIKAKAFISRAISASHAASNATDAFKDSDFYHIEMQHYQTLVTCIQSLDSKLKVAGSQRIPGGGILRLQDKWLHIVRERLIANSRFDPMHSGETEQQLFSQLYDHIVLNLDEAAWKSGTIAFNVTHNEQTFSEEFSKEELSAPFRSLLDEIRAITGDALLLLDAHFKHIPGVSQTDGSIILSSENSVTTSAIEIAASSPQTEDIPYIREVDISASTASSATGNLRGQSISEDNSTNNFATHLLLEGIAYPPAHYELSITESARKLALERTASGAHIVSNEEKLALSNRAGEMLVNGHIKTEGYCLMPGDVVTLQGHPSENITLQLTAILVRD